MIKDVQFPMTGVYIENSKEILKESDEMDKNSDCDIDKRENEMEVMFFAKTMKQEQYCS